MLLVLQRQVGNGAIASAMQSTRAGNAYRPPPDLTAAIESLSAISLNDVRVNYNSSRPTELGALAVAEGSEIHLAPGQERHLPHEAWHVVQQAEGRVTPTQTTEDGSRLNDDEALEAEADAMGARAVAISVRHRDPEPAADSSHGPARNSLSGRRTPAATQLRRPRAVREAMQSTALTQAEHAELTRVARQFVALMNAADRTAFKHNTAAGRQAYLTGAPPFRIGDVVEAVGQVQLGQHAAKTFGEGSRQITSVTLRFADALGTPQLGDLAELDALVLDPDGNVGEVVTAKLNPGQVNPAQDRALLTPFYAVEPQRRPDQRAARYYTGIKEVFPHIHANHLANNGIEGFCVEYDENGGHVVVSLKEFRRAHPLKTGAVASTPVRGLTPTSDTPGQVQSAEARDDIKLGLNRTDLLDALARQMVEEIG